MLCVLVVVDTQLKAVNRLALLWRKSAVGRVNLFLLYRMTALSSFNAVQQLTL